MRIESFTDKLAVLFKLGHFSKIDPKLGDSLSREAWKALKSVIKNESHSLFKKAVQSLREYSGGAAQSTVFDSELVEIQKQRICSCPDIMPSFADGSLRGWAQREVTLWHGLSRAGRTEMPGLTADEITRRIDDALRIVNGWSGWTVEQVEDGRPDIYCLAVFLDGNNSVLADMVLPNPKQNNAETAGERSRQLRGRFDTGDARSYQNANFFKKVFIHELLHAAGIGHSRSQGDIMFPSILNTELEPGQGDIRELESRYGKYESNSPADPKDPEDPDSPNKYQEELTITCGDRSFAVPARMV